MARAGKKSSTKWILLSEARAWGIEVYEKTVGAGHAAKFAEDLILKGCETGQIPWDSSHSEGPGQYLVGRPEFWRNDRLIPEPAGLVILNPTYVRIDYEKNSVSRSSPNLICYLVKLDKDAFAKLLPAVDTGGNDTTLT